MDLSELRKFRDTLELPVPDDKLEDAPFYHPGSDSEEVRYMLERPVRCQAGKGLILLRGPP